MKISNEKSHLLLACYIFIYVKIYTCFKENYFQTMMTTRRLRFLIMLLWVVPIIFVGSWFFMIPGDGFRHPQCRQFFYNRLPFRLSVFVSFVVPLLGKF